MRLELQDIEQFGIYCMVCGDPLGHMTTIKKLSTFSPINWLPVCNTCFNKKIGKPISSIKVKHPFNTGREPNDQEK